MLYIYKHVIFEVMNDALEWLDNWEDNLNNNIIKEDEFLTKQTAEGLRVTLKSTIDLVNYLLNDCGFAYVLTSKLNQDCLEVSNFKYYLEFINLLN